MNLPDVGEVLFRKSSKAKNLNIIIKPFAPITVSVPFWLSFSKAERIVKGKTSWIKKKSAIMKESESSCLQFDENTNFKTKYHELEIKKGEKRFSRVTKDKILITLDSYENIRSDDTQKYIRKAIERALRKEAQEYIPIQVDKLANDFGFKFSGVAIRNARTRWGSCSYKNNLNFSLHLMRLPYHLIDYIILHELTHTKIKNHSRFFKSELEKVCPEFKKYEQELKKNKLKLW